VPLTELETEYVVSCVKHIFARHVVFQFAVTNTLNDQVLEQAQVVMEGGLQELDEGDVVMIPAARLAYGAPGYSYVAFPLDPSIRAGRQPAHAHMPPPAGGMATDPARPRRAASQSFSAHLDFVVKDCDPETGECDEEGYEDTYTLEGVALQVADLMRAVDKPNFGAAWEELAVRGRGAGAMPAARLALTRPWRSRRQGGAEKTETFELSTMTGLEDAVVQITRFLGMEPCEKSHKVPADKSTHTLFLSGLYPGGHRVLARAKLAFDRAVTLQLTVRSDDEATAALVAAAIGG
jgi:coatomer protein complex subunit gamma